MFPPDGDNEQAFSEFWDLEIELDGAIERGELLLGYQPQLRVADLVPVGAEALMVWPHRARGLVSPEQFIPIAEKTGQIRPMTMWALNPAMRPAARWTHASPLAVSGNVPSQRVEREDQPASDADARQPRGEPYEDKKVE